jgi:hypothetical protein
MGIDGYGRKPGKLNWSKRIDHQKQWEFERRDQQHERMVKEFFEKKKKERKKRKRNNARKRNN